MLTVDHAHLETPLTWTVEEARLRLGIGQAKLDELIIEGKIQILEIGPLERVTEQSIQAVINERHRSTAYRIGEAAQRLGIKSHLLEDLISEGKIQADTSDGVTWIAGAALERFISDERKAKAA